MFQNKIKVKRAEVGISQAALASKMPDDVNKITMSFIESGRCLPTRGGLRAMCEVFGCHPKDLYDLIELELASVGVKPDRESSRSSIPAQAAKGASGSESWVASIVDHGERDRHEGMEQIRVWVPAVEKAALRKAITGLGYHSLAEWMREKYRQTLNQYIELKIAKNITSDALGNNTSSVPPVHGNQRV